MHNSIEITQENLYRYPGAKSFTSEQAHLFMGRALDIEQFYALIQARQVVVLYGKSGMGKSSLINAGIVPLLQDTTKPAIYFNIRLFNKEQGGLQEAITPVNNLISTLLQEIEEQGWMLPLKQEGLLWYWLKQWQWQNPKVPIMLFFDQFEELFTYTEEEVAEFGNELRSIIYQNTADLLDDLDTSIFTDEQLDFLYQKIDFRLVFIIRSDRMALLNKLTKYIPHIQKHFYELDAISETDAKEAIIKPAQLQDQAYASNPFDYEPSIVQVIIKQVKNQHDGKIETATLQIICSYIERQKVIEERQSLINANVLGNIQHIFRDFYQSTLNKLNKQDKDLVSQTIEVNFIQNKQRIPFAEEHLKQVYRLSQIVLDELEKSTLLRKERDTAGRYIYEIGHDTLIEPILEFAKIREQENRNKRFISFLSIGFVIITGLIGIILYMSKINNKATSLYWASESNKINPIQGLALLEEAFNKTSDSSVLYTIKEKVIEIFNLSHSHQFQERRRFTNTSKSAFSPDSKWLITKYYGDNIKIWSVEKEIKVEFLKDEKYISDATFSSDSKWLITIDKYNNTKVWSVEKGMQAGFLKDEQYISYAIFSPNNKWLFTKYYGGNAKVWVVEKGIQLGFLKDEKYISSATFSSDSKWLITNHYGGNAKVWVVEKGIQLGFLKDEKYIHKAIFSPDSKWLITRDMMYNAKVWAVEKGIQLQFLKNEKNIHKVIFSPDSKWLITIDKDNNTKVWSVEKEMLYYFLKCKKNDTPTFSQDTKWLTTTDENNSSKVWFIERGIQAEFLKYEKSIYHATFSSNSKWLTTENVNHETKVWAVDNGIEANFLKNEKNIYQATFSIDSKWLVTKHRDGDTKVWLVEKGIQADFLKNEKNIYQVFFSQNSKWLVTIDKSENTKIWALDRGIQKQSFFVKDEATIILTTFSKDSKWLVTIDKNENTKVWFMDSGKEVNPLKEGKKIYQATFYKDSKWLLIKNKNYYTKVWNTKNRIVPNFLKQEKNIGLVNFSKDNKILSIITNHKVKTYEVATGKLIQTLWLNKVPTQVDIIDNRYLYVTVGKAIVKTDLQTQQGNLMSYGDGEELDYKYEEIQEWIKVFGDKYLLPLDEEIKKKYGVD